ncbi:hypothetical protein HID58_087973 [Brassica napus]|uniref:DNA-3-methyladenine glycosylase I n=2 Tax=Brassica napus TaxID=3708 RepID=A0ABQ7XUU2_BRANA|nr:uncharacterized protein LOC106418531 [Brassica napus]KAH0859712.1 hypothetical protein HID58_087973 [Brassica napus]CDY49387.1 BnaC09g53540D [Brassica napus]
MTEERDEKADDCFSDDRKRCAWIAPKSDQSCIAFHNEEWGVPVHDDKYVMIYLLLIIFDLSGRCYLFIINALICQTAYMKISELLSLPVVLPELSWKYIRFKRQSFRKFFKEFDSIPTSELTNKKREHPLRRCYHPHYYP